MPPLRSLRRASALALLAVTVAAQPPPPDGVEVVASGLASPFGIAAAPDGALWVVEQGTGADDARVSIVTSTGEVFPFLTGLQSAESEGEVTGTWKLLLDGDDLWITQGLQDSFESYLLRVSTAGFTPGDAPLTPDDLDLRQHVGAFVQSLGYAESNLYDLAVGPGGDLFLVDAAANAVLRRDAATGALSLFAEVPGVPNPTPVGPPVVEAVPTGIVATDDGFLLTSLTGFPFVDGLSRVQHLGLDGAVTLVQDGFTSLTDVALDPVGRHPVVLTFAAFELAPPPDGGFQPGTGALTALFDAGPAPLAAGLNLTPAFTFGPDGALYVTSLFGRVLKIMPPGNLPPVPQGVASGDLIEVTVGAGSVSLPFSFISPEPGQTTTIDLVETVDGAFPGFFELDTTPGNPATAEASFSVSPGLGISPGDYGFEITATDDGSPAASTTVPITVRVSFPPTAACEPGADMYIIDFDADGVDPLFTDGEYVRLYSFEFGPLDLAGCSIVAVDAATEEVVFSYPLTDTIQPFTEPIYEDGADFPAGSIPDGPGAIAVVEGTPAVGTGVGALVDHVVNAIVYRTDQDIFGQAPTGPFASLDGGGLEEMLAQLRAVTAEGDGALDLSVTAAPNPVAERGRVAFGLAEAADVRVSLFDALGREVAVLAEGPRGRGRHEVAVDASALPSGVYVVWVSGGGEVRTARLTVAR